MSAPPRWSPATPEEVAAAVGELAAGGRRTLVRGGGTLLHVADPGPEPEVELDTTALAAVVTHEPADLIVTCQAGVTLAALDRRVRGAGQVLPVWHPDPGRATVGGLVAFGWTGLGRRLYGRLRDRVLEVRAVTGEGKLVRGGARVVKNVTGFDLPRLFVGSMGTLGVIVEASLKVHPAPGPLWSVEREGEEAVVLARWLRAGIGAARMPVEAVLVGRGGRWRAVAFAPGPREDAAALLGCFEGAGQPGAGEEAFLALATDPVLVGAGGEVVVRAAVPPAAAPELVGRLAAAPRALVDAASGVAWAVLGGGKDEVVGLRSWCEGQGGSLVLLAAPPGLRAAVGTWASGPPPGAGIMRRLKAQFDPRGILGPGRFVV